VKTEPYDNQDQLLPCGDKLVFDTKEQAQATAVVAEHTYGTKLYPYICRYCGLWHLSSGVA
jgi:hypothetical protein